MVGNEWIKESADVTYDLLLLLQINSNSVISKHFFNGNKSYFIFIFMFAVNKLFHIYGEQRIVFMLLW